MKQIKWKFKSTDIYFVSSEKQLTRDVMRQRERLRLKPTTKIEIINEFFTTDNSTSTGCSSCGNSSSNQEQSTLSVDFNEAETAGEEADGLQPVSDLLDDAVDSSSNLEAADSASSSDGGNSFSDGDMDGQVD